MIGKKTLNFAIERHSRNSQKLSYREKFIRLRYVIFNAIVHQKWLCPHCGLFNIVHWHFCVVTIIINSSNKVMLLITCTNAHKSQHCFFLGIVTKPTILPLYPSTAHTCVTPNITSFSFWSMCTYSKRKHNKFSKL